MTADPVKEAEPPRPSVNLTPDPKSKSISATMSDMVGSLFRRNFGGENKSPLSSLSFYQSMNQNPSPTTSSDSQETVLVSMAASGSSSSDKVSYIFLFIFMTLFIYCSNCVVYFCCTTMVTSGSSSSDKVSYLGAERKFFFYLYS